MSDDSTQTLLELLSKGTEKERVYGVADVLFQMERYVRSASLALTGFVTKHDAVVARDVFALIRMMDELGAWMKRHHMALYKHAEPRQVGLEEAMGEKSVVH